jgi:hypothetical protein
MTIESAAALTSTEAAGGESLLDGCADRVQCE